MKQAIALDPASVNAHLLRLADLFRQFESVAVEQTRNIVDHRFEEIGNLADKQAHLNEELKTVEGELAKTLSKLTESAGIRGLNASITNIEPYLADASATRELRSAVRAAMSDAKQRQHELMQLLQFGQRQIGDTLKAIHALASGRDVRYDQTGRLVENPGGRVVNRKG